MFLEIQFTLASISASSSNNSGTTNSTNESKTRCNAAIDLYLQTLRSWGPISSLEERIRIHSQPSLFRPFPSSHPHREPSPSPSSPSIGRTGGENEPNDLPPPKPATAPTTYSEIYRAEAERAIAARTTQSAANYLGYPELPIARSPPAGGSGAAPPLRRPLRPVGPGTASGALVDTPSVLDGLRAVVAPAPPPVPPAGSGPHLPAPVVPPAVRSVAVRAVAELHFMRGEYEEALVAYLTIHSERGAETEGLLERIEKEAIGSIYSAAKPGPKSRPQPRVDPVGAVPNGGGDFERYGHVLTIIETHRMHALLLRRDLLGRSSPPAPSGTDDPAISNPLVALVCLVGPEPAGRFLVEHCTLPRRGRGGGGMVRSPSATTVQSANSYGSSSSTATSPPISSSALPVDLVASMLGSRPGLLFWFLDRLVREKPEVYVKFPSTAVPPSAVTDLHRIHFELHVEFAPDRRLAVGGGGGGEAVGWSVRKRLAVVPSYEEEVESPLMSFLKVALPHGGIRFAEVRQTLERCRSTSSPSPPSPKTATATPSGTAQQPPPTATTTHHHPHVFARELAHMIEQSGGSVTDNEARATEDARTVLNLYLEGVVSLPLAVAYAERRTSHSAMLWEMLVSYCLGTTEPSAAGPAATAAGTGPPGTSGALFGSLLEVAARSGADLAHLIVCVPPEMRIEGIRPKLVAAIFDYRLKLKIHESASDVFLSDKVSLLRDQCHRARRGLRIDLPGCSSSSSAGVDVGDGGDRNGAVVPPSSSGEGKGGVDTRRLDGGCTTCSRDILERKRKQRRLLSMRNERNPGLTVRKPLTIR